MKILLLFLHITQLQTTETLKINKRNPREVVIHYLAPLPAADERRACRQRIVYSNIRMQLRMWKGRWVFNIELALRHFVKYLSYIHLRSSVCLSSCHIPVVLS
jgi:hypothetical protein